jgi:hypothetical protein
MTSRPLTCCLSNVLVRSIWILHSPIDNCYLCLHLVGRTPTTSFLAASPAPYIQCTSQDIMLALSRSFLAFLFLKHLLHDGSLLPVDTNRTWVRDSPVVPFPCG